MINTVYLAGPIDLGKDIKWKDILAKKLADAKISLITFNPATAFKWIDGETIGMAPAVANYIEEVNNLALDMANLVVCSLPKGIQTVGTIVELDRCMRNDKKVILLTNIDVSYSAYLVNRTDPAHIVYTCHDEDKIEASIDAALDVVVSQIKALNSNDYLGPND